MGSNPTHSARISASTLKKVGAALVIVLFIGHLICYHILVRSKVRVKEIIIMAYGYGELEDKLIVKIRKMTQISKRAQVLISLVINTKEKLEAPEKWSESKTIEFFRWTIYR